MQKTEVTGAPEALGQRMLQNQPQELWPRQCPGLHLFGFAVLVAESHQAIPASDNILFLDHALVKIAPQINLGESLFLRKLLWASLPNKRQKLRDR